MKMLDVLWEDKETGELLTAPEAIRQFYTVEGHKYPDCWTDRYQETSISCEIEIAEPEKLFA